MYLYRSATELAALIREGKATSEAVVREHLAHIRQHNNAINALVTVFEEEALAEARRCDLEAAEGRFRGPLHGVPVTIKEQYWIKGKHCSTNFCLLKDFVAPEDAVTVSRIRQSGAVILGQTNVPKNLLDYQVRGDQYPEGKNPYNPEYTPGGSTGGGAAALAAGFTTLELGSDFGGSIRVPSSFCGLYGLKPTEKTIPHYGSVPVQKTRRSSILHMVQAGPLARTPEDLELLWKILVGPHVSDRNVADIHWREPVAKEWSGYRIAFTTGWPGYNASRTVAEATRAFVSRLAEAGCHTKETIPGNNLHHETLRLYVSIFPYIIAQGVSWYVRKMIKWQLIRGLLKGKHGYWHEMNRAFRMNVNYYGESMYDKSRITRQWEEFFSRYDLLICPVAFGPAFKRCKTGSRLHYEDTDLIYLDYVWPYVGIFNASGNPSITIPLGLSKEGLPIGVQIVGRYWSEPELFAFAKKIAPLVPGFIRPAGF
jgi:amidase